LSRGTSGSLTQLSGAGTGGTWRSVPGCGGRFNQTPPRHGEGCWRNVRNQPVCRLCPPITRRSPRCGWCSNELLAAVAACGESPRPPALAGAGGPPGKPPAPWRVGRCPPPVLYHPTGGIPHISPRWHQAWLVRLRDAFAKDTCARCETISNRRGPAGRYFGPTGVDSSAAKGSWSATWDSDMFSSRS